ncbi:uncharacterized protein EMH_0074460 [Eimeria mitis]|uniref:Uncharacterized protein n=1 Tax=Eimeria mitis TaxID=44415 RepID=U6KGY4_9EIME|nr:uncharacterized protein EMH_0074460 [Eimeria mitis]CDJ35512.1 hypothetical protein, conserved [Eimeria mitis]
MPSALFKATTRLRQQGREDGRGPKEQKGLQQHKEQKELQQQKREEACYAALETELLQLLRHSRLQLEQLQQEHDADGASAEHSSSNNSNCGEGKKLLYRECAIKSAASWASLLQNVQTLSVLQQQLQRQQKRHQQQQPEASEPGAAAAAAITAFVQELQQLCNSNNSCSSSIRGLLVVPLPRKRVYWQQQQQQQQQQLLLQLVDQVLADLAAWAEEFPSDGEASVSPVPAQVAATEQQQGRRQQAFSEEGPQNLLLEDRRNRELLLQCNSNPKQATATADAAPVATPAAAQAAGSHLEEHLLDTAHEMKQGALMFRERLQKDNILLRRTAATQEALQHQQQRGLDAAKKLLRFSFFSSLMPLVQLAIALAVTLAMISFILVTPG